jgi:hypothetical protein
MSMAQRDSPIFLEEELEDALHALAQPLTALSFLTEMGAMQSDPDILKGALEAAATETRRAMESLRLAQQTAAKLFETQGGAA